MRVLLLSLLLLGLATAANAQAAAEEGTADPGWQEGYSADSLAVLEAEADLPAAETTDSALQNILAKPEYQGDFADTSQVESILDKFLNWLQQNMPGLFPAGSSGTANWIVIALLGAVIVLLAYLIVRICWALAARRGVRELAGSEQQQELSTAKQLLIAAQQAAAKGQYREALRLRFRAVVRSIDLPTTTLLTNYQLIRRIEQQTQTAVTPFRKLVVCFEDAWYGSLPCGAGEYNVAADLATQVEAELVQDTEDRTDAQE